jgi:ribosomal protein S18 acetylase RimI-like enzyme
MSKTETNYTIDEIRESEWIEVADLTARAIPNALISKLGNRFGARFYRKIVQQEYSCGYVARNSSGNVVGVIIGSADYPEARSTAIKEQLLKLVITANFRLISWSFINWVIKGVVAKAKGEKKTHKDKPSAELIAVAVRPEAQGTGLAQKLVEKMEIFMLSKNLSGPYAILTEKANITANRFYKKIGATFVKTSTYHGREINEWDKVITLTIHNENRYSY